MTLSIIEQVQAAFQRRNLAATIVGLAWGAFVPVGVYCVAHSDLRADMAPWLRWAFLALALGGLVYSASTVYSWTERAVRSRVKAAGFVVLVEGIMLLSQVQLLAYAALAILIAINAIATGCNLSADRKEARAKRAPKRPRAPARKPARKKGKSK
jgi:hypothetical protein